MVVVVVVVVVVEVLSPPPSPEPVSKRASERRGSFGEKLVAFQSNVLVTIVFAGRSSVSSVEYSIQTDSLLTFSRLKVNPVI